MARDGQGYPRRRRHMMMMIYMEKKEKKQNNPKLDEYIMKVDFER